jgi:hypothetical protein
MKTGMRHTKRESRDVRGQSYTGGLPPLNPPL